jgi:D-alanyl-D-alanine carboxypeptidase (penicillin-binding protein 5/6)
VRGGQAEFAALGIAEDIYVTIPRGTYAQLAASMDVLADLVAPLSTGTRVGEVKISLAGTELAKSAVVVLTAVTDGGVWARMRDELSTIWE